MALLIIDLDKHIGTTAAWRDTFKQHLPELEIRFWPETGDVNEIDYLAFMHPDFGALPEFPNLESHVHPRRWRRVVRAAPQTAQGASRQAGAADRRSHDDRVRHHARAALSSRHAGLSRSPGAQGMAARADRPPRGPADRFLGVRHDGQGASPGPAIAGFPCFGLGPQSPAGRRSPDLSWSRPT